MKYIALFAVGFALLLPCTVAVARIPTTVKPGDIRCPRISYKQTKSFMEGVMEIPSTWSYYYAGEHFGATTAEESFPYPQPYMSIAQDGVAFGDMNWNQVDFFALSGTAVSKLLRETKAQEQHGTWSKQSVGGRRADVLTYKTDNGEVSKGGTGGKAYFLSWKEKVKEEGVWKTYDVGLLIRKQALGNTEFECGVAHALESLDTGRLYYNYPEWKTRK